MAEETSTDAISELKRIIQIGLIVEDVEKAVEGMRQVFGVEPAFVKFMDYPFVEYHGEPTDARARIAGYDQFGVQLEFIQPTGDGPSTWKDHLLQGGTSAALHHIRFNDVDDNDAVTDAFAKRGVELCQEGGSVVNPGAKFSYYDTIPQVGFVSEVVTKVAE